MRRWIESWRHIFEFGELSVPIFLRALARFVFTAVIVANAITFSQAQAQTPPEVARGLQWLIPQVQADGSLLNEPQSIATQLQNRSEAAQTLKLLATVPPGLTSIIAAEPEDNSEYLARKAVSLAVNGFDPTSYVNLLLQRQGLEGGFGPAPNYASNLGDTAWTVLALAQANQGGSDAAKRARAYLAAQLQPDGGISGNTDASRTHNSAIALLALQTTPDSSNATAVRSLAAWLQQRQAADGSWSADTYLSAFVLSAIFPVTADATVRNTARTFLASTQVANGSWNDDPFLTALVLRVLSMQYTPAPTTGNLQGQVVDNATNAPLSGVTVALAGAASQTATTDATGHFSLSGLAPGSYSASYSRTGYNGGTASYSITAGQMLDVGMIRLAQLPTKGIIHGQVTSSAQVALPGVTVSLSGAATMTAISDADGRYEFIVASPGAFTIAAILSGYQTANASGTIAAGQTVVFSPVLYTNSETAVTTIRYLGKVVSAGQSTPLANVAIQITGTASSSATTSPTGQFDLTMNPGSYTATFTLAGYTSVSQTFVASAGTTVDGGNVALSPIRTSSSVTGKVIDTSNAAIAGATVQVVGTTSVATSAADGSYTLSGIAGNSFSLRASATGYNTETVGLQVSGPGDFSQNFTLSAQSAGNLAIGALTVTPASVGSNANVSAVATISNSGNADASAVLQMLVFDANQTLAGKGSAYDAGNNLIGQVTLAAGQQLDVRFAWNSAQFAPGAYVLDARLVQPGSISKEMPQGSMLVERAGALTITSQAHFAGSIIANPPVLQAGTNTAIKLSAIVQNDGNADLPAQTYTLTVIDIKDGSIVTSQQLDGAALPVNGTQTLVFADWTPAKGGNFRLELTAVDTALGKLIGSLYVGDAARASYTVNKLVVPTGTQTVRGTISVTGQDVTSGSISDPLAPLIKTAVNKAMAYNYPTAVYDTLSSRCLRCHVQTQALVGGELTRKLTDESALRTNRDILLNSISTHQQSNGAIDGYTGGYYMTQSMLGMWALNAWHKKDEILTTLAKGANYLTTDQNANGSWSPDHASGWWSTGIANTAFNVKSLTEVYALLTQAPAGSAKNYDLAHVTNQNINGPYHLASDATGNVYASNYNTGIVQMIKPDGTSLPYMTGLSNVTALVFAADGTAYASSSAGLYKRNADGTSTRITTQRGTGLALGPDGNLYLSSYWDNKIYKVTPAGVVSDYIVGGALSNPWAIAFSASGDLVVANYNGQNILRYHADKTYDIPVGWTYSGPRSVQPTADGWLVTTDTGLYFYNSEWHGERQLYTNVGGVTVKPDGSIVVGDIGTNWVSKLTSTPIDTVALRAKMATSIGTGTTWLLADANTDNSNNLSLAQRLIGLNAAKQFYQGQPLADTLQAKMLTVGTLLRSHVRVDGGWGWTTGYASDSLVTAQVGFALDTLNPSASDPIVQNAVKLLLSRQKADGTWPNENGILSTPLAATTWVSIWLPIVLDRLGGVDTDLSVTFPANVTMANPDLVPTSSTVNGDGTKTNVWHLTGVTSAGRTINYDLTLQNMALNEVRPVSIDAHLTFKNSFTGGTVNAAIDVPRVTASAFLGLGVTTDKQSYPADANVGITGQVTNTGATPLSGRVSFDIYAPDNTVVASLGSAPFSGLAAGANVNLGMNWNAGKTLAGTGYYVLATLYNSADQMVGTAKAVFAITGVDAGTTGLSGVITTDKQIYQASETVKLADRITNVTANALLNNLTIVTTINNPDGTLRFTKTETLAQLLPGSLKDYNYSVPLNAAPAGQYNATLVVTAADGTLLAMASTRFTVALSSTSGYGLTGTLAAAPKQVPLGDTALINFSAINNGNGTYANLPLTVRIIEPNTQSVIASFPYTATLNTGATFSASTSWPSSGPINTTYVAVLSAVVGSNTLTLAQDTFTVVAPPIKLDITQGISNGGRVLVLVSCNDDESEIPGNNGKPADCVTQRSQAIDQALTALGVMHTITTSEAAFKLAYRSGLYNTYWISGKEDKLHDDLTSEIREAVFGGDGLILDGVHDQRNKVLDTVVGVTFKGKVGETNLPVDLAAPLFTAQRLQTLGRALKIDLSGATQNATFAGQQPTATGPGIVTSQYGAGHAILFAFDLVSSLQAQGSWQPILGIAVQNVLPAQSANLVPAGVLPVKTTIVNQANATDVDVKTVLPAGANYLSATPAATYDGATRTVDWTFNLAASKTQNLSLLIDVPATAGDFNLQTIVATVKNGTATPYGAPLSLAFHVTTAQQSASAAIANLNGLQLGAAKDQKLRDSLVAQLQAAMTEMNKSTAAGEEAAIGALIGIIGQLSSLPVNTGAVHDSLDRILKEAQWRWSLTQQTP